MRFLCGPFLRQLSSVLTIMFCRRRRRWMVTRGRGSHPAGCARRVLLEERTCSRFLRLRNAYDNGRAVKDSGGATEQDGAGQSGQQLVLAVDGRRSARRSDFDGPQTCGAAGPRLFIEVCVLHQHQLADKTVKIERRHFRIVACTLRVVGCQIGLP